MENNNIKTIPMTTDEIQELFLNPDREYKIDLKNSRLKGEAFATYLANMKMRCSLIEDSELPSEEKYDLLKNFLTYPYAILCTTLVDVSCILFLRSKGLPVKLTNSWMSFDEIDTFLKEPENQDILKRCSLFLESMLVTIPSFNNDVRESFLLPAIEASVIEQVDDPSYVSVNLYGAITTPEFLELYLSQPPLFDEKPKYFKNVVEKYSYDLKTLYDLFLKMGEDSLLLSLTNLIMSEEQEEKELISEFLNA